MPYQGDLTNVVTDVYREWQGDFRNQIDTATNVAMDAAAMAGDPTSGLSVGGGDLVLAAGYDLEIVAGDLEVLSGNIQVSGTVNDQTISSSASFTGSVTIANGLSVNTGSAAFSGGTKIGASGTPLTQVKVYTPTLTPGTVLASLSAEQTFSVPGLTIADSITVSGPAPTAGSGLVNARVSAADTLALTFINDTLASLTPASGVYRIVAVRS